MAEKRDEKSTVDIFKALQETSKKQKKAKREQLLKAVDVKEFFDEGSINIDMKTCKGVECEFCIKACPTKALYWKAGEIAITRDLCVYCTCCVLNCMVDGCITVTRKRNNGVVEQFKTPADVLALNESINTEKRIDKVQKLLPDQEAYLKRYIEPYFTTEDNSG